jgi:hypothetical protein
MVEVHGGQIMFEHFATLNWTRLYPPTRRLRKPSAGLTPVHVVSWEAALDSTTRRQRWTLEDLQTAEEPIESLQYVHDLLSRGERLGVAVVSHTTHPELVALCHAFRDHLHREIPNIPCVTTGILEAIRRHGLCRLPEETPDAFLERLQVRAGEAPTAAECLADLGLDPGVHPANPVWGACATHVLYEYHRRRARVGDS